MLTPTPGEERVVVAKFGRRAFEQTFTFPDGKKEEFFLVGAGKTAEAFSPPTIILPVTADRNVVAIRQYRYAAQEVLSEIPGGNPKKATDDAAEVGIAELVEETGFVPERVINLGGGYWFDPASWRAHFNAFLALDCRKEKEPKLDRGEFLEQFEVPLDEWIAMILRGEIKDAKTILVTFLALPHLGLSIS